MTAVDNPDYVTGYTPGGATIMSGSLGPCIASGTVQTPVTACAAFSSILMNINVFGIQPCTVTISFFSDPFGSSPVGIATTFKKTSATTTTWAFPVLGPFVQVALTNNGGVTITNTVVFAAGLVNAAISTLKATGIYTLIDQQGAAIGASATVFLTPTNPATANTQCLPGKAKLWMSVSQNYATGLQIWNGAAWDTMAGFAGNANQNQVFDINLPLSDWRLYVANQAAAAGTFFLGMVLGE